jgi:anti-anti-sigma factor
MTYSECFQSELVDDVLVVSFQIEEARIEEFAMMNKQQVLSHKFNKSRAVHAIVDFRQLSYFGSLMLEDLLQLWKAVKAKDGRMALCNLSQTGREIIGVSRFDQLWPVCETQEKAMQSVLNRNFTK